MPTVTQGVTSPTSNAIELATTRLDVPPEAVRALATWLSPAELRRADRYRFERDRRRFIVARARLRQLLARRLMTRPDAVELVYRGNGKPALPQQGGVADWRFNVSRSDEIAVYAFCLGREVGIDVEAIREVRDADAIVSHFFSRCECEAYMALCPDEKTLGFFNCWTRKEALLKALGDGLCRRLDGFDVSLAPGQPARILRIDNTSGWDSGWGLDSFSPSPGFVAAVVSERHATGVAGATLQ